MRDPHTNTGKGIGYVLFKSRTAALAALNLNGVDFGGRALRVMRVKASAGGVNAVKVAPKKGKGADKSGAGRRVAGGKAVAAVQGSTESAPPFPAAGRVCCHALRSEDCSLRLVVPYIAHNCSEVRHDAVRALQQACRSCRLSGHQDKGQAEASIAASLCGRWRQGPWQGRRSQSQATRSDGAESRAAPRPGSSHFSRGE